MMEVNSDIAKRKNAKKKARDADAKARAEFEAKARADVEATLRAEFEAKARADVEAKLRAEFEAKARVRTNEPNGGGSSARKKAPSREKVPPPMRRRVWHDGDKMCVLCHVSLNLDNFEVAHIQAHAKGGQLVLANLTVLCAACNRSVGTQNVDKYRVRHGL